MQTQFAAALLDPDAAMPVGLQDPSGRVDAKRFSVYRNNVASSLTSVLEAGFPVVQKLVGEAFFAAMATNFLRNHPPQTRLMMLYGADFADFLQRFSPVAHLGYLPDIARLEQAIRESYHAADHRSVAMNNIAALGDAEILAARFELAPSLRLIRSSWPIHAIWTANTEGGPPPVAVAQDVVVLRRDFDPRPHLLPVGGGAVVEGLLKGQRLSDTGAEPELLATLSVLLANGAIVGVSV
jgi:Putative DNA-binding domain